VQKHTRVEGTVTEEVDVPQSITHESNVSYPGPGSQVVSPDHADRIPDVDSVESEDNASLSADSQHFQERAIEAQGQVHFLQKELDYQKGIVKQLMDDVGTLQSQLDEMQSARATQVMLEPCGTSLVQRTTCHADIASSY
jgi:hypothetical protein